MREQFKQYCAVHGRNKFTDRDLLRQQRGFMTRPSARNAERTGACFSRCGRGRRGMRRIGRESPATCDELAPLRVSVYRYPRGRRRAGGGVSRKGATWFRWCALFQRDGLQPPCTLNGKPGPWVGLKPPLACPIWWIPRHPGCSAEGFFLSHEQRRVKTHASPAQRQKTATVGMLFTGGVHLATASEFRGPAFPSVHRSQAARCNRTSCT